MSIPEYSELRSSAIEREVNPRNLVYPNSNYTTSALSLDITGKDLSDDSLTSTTEIKKEEIIKEIPVIKGEGAKIFLDELEDLEYSDETKEFYREGEELVKAFLRKRRQ